MNINKTKFYLYCFLLIINFSDSFAEGVEIKNIESKTTVNGAVTNAAIGDKNKTSLNIGGVSGKNEPNNLNLRVNLCNYNPPPDWCSGIKTKNTIGSVVAQ
ncbi:hypothetical protein [Methylobacter tundripaludum]|uniref:Uncharacterized protein n=1 Tax=Methylobacter tundripaludum (strain ATCC BAA-1195 / DSM 17260 / SV96) TaxID=697282 RepID=G3J104_METTV|nr:hypothetical protein [Methylobacter tundripaludum]EGW20876.1 hypothetical protein Mettu_4028 [Methylobacter tundripaludum SV96]